MSDYAKMRGIADQYHHEDCGCLDRYLPFPCDCDGPQTILALLDELAARHEKLRELPNKWWAVAARIELEAPQEAAAYDQCADELNALLEDE